MPQCRVLKGGWFWKGELMIAGQILLAPSEQWIDNRIADNGLVERIVAEEPAIETAAVTPPETAVIPRTRAKGR